MSRSGYSDDLDPLARVRHGWVYDIDDHATRRWQAMRAWAVAHLTKPAEQEAR